MDVFVHNESVWLTQKAMRDLFYKSKSIVSEHISNVFKEGELDKNQVVRKFRTTADDGKDYFEELLERIREIRASEQRFYQKITDIYAQCSVDYDANSELTQNIYKTVQNKLHWAITGSTAAEIIHKKVDSKKANMGLTTLKNSHDGKILKSDIGTA